MSNHLIVESASYFQGVGLDIYNTRLHTSSSVMVHVSEDDPDFDAQFRVVQEWAEENGYDPESVEKARPLSEGYQFRIEERR